jgi:hypothetical protein
MAYSGLIKFSNYEDLIPRANMSKQLQNRKTRKNTQENFRRRKINLISKADDLYRFFGADIFLVIQKRGKYCGYNSREELDWPPIKEELVSLFYRHLKIATNKLLGT